jgi:hypothetical protein
MVMLEATKDFFRRLFTPKFADYDSFMDALEGLRLSGEDLIIATEAPF